MTAAGIAANGTVQFTSVYVHGREPSLARAPESFGELFFEIGFGLHSVLPCLTSAMPTGRTTFPIATKQSTLFGGRGVVCRDDAAVTHDKTLAFQPLDTPHELANCVLDCLPILSSDKKAVHDLRANSHYEIDIGSNEAALCHPFDGMTA
jgi:hypothetical protein